MTTMAGEMAPPTPTETLQDVSPDQDDRLDVPGVIDDYLVLGSVKHAHDARLLKHLHISYMLDAENARKRSAVPLEMETLIERGRVELDDDDAYESFKENVKKATEMIRAAREGGRTVFVFCTHGNNEGAVVCMTYLMLAERWTLERAHRHVLQKRPASAPRRAYVEKLRLLEREVHGHVTLRSAQVGPSMIDLMLGLRGESRPEDADETASQVTEPESVAESTVERASFMSNFSMNTGLHNGSSLRETMIIAERDEEYEVAAANEPPSFNSITGGRTPRSKNNRKDCIIS